MVSRTDRSQFAEWWWTVDRFLLFGILALMVGGVVLSFAASPPVAERLHLDTYHFVKRQALFLVPAVAILFGVSLLSPRQIRRVALVVLIGAVLMMLLTLFAGFEVKGARRWLSLFGMSIQPSEFVKPAFVVISAFLFAENSRRPEVPGNALAVLLLSIVLALLVAQPDFGQAVLLSLVWCALFFMAGLPWLWIALLSVAGVFGALAAYSLLPHVALRIDRFLDPSSGDTFQVDTAIESFIRGGWLGRGPGEGTVKRILPDSHTDFTFAVAAEEFGIVLCMLLVLIFAFVVLRGFSHAMRKEDGFERLAAAGLVVLFGLQSIINMAVNVQLMPAKGMTLPFISYGGSSLLALALAMGFLLALTRRRPETMTRRPPVVFEPLARNG
ncbi:putative lipid II flippase FtsW [Rhodobium gokarnense]|uniref:Probable peptidoglycan glycosyltransferase FtsW n=1 Tax=Rhodobium gokarnense TaxID=364296 RepID=A0ABT3H9G2_9HYPH|nr:putative lipid II flippase FtsW [Rhodobium gokarnense]MCW2307035.1 cell division protein FtsW [Rhodobium gokarnense]